MDIVFEKIKYPRARIDSAAAYVKKRIPRRGFRRWTVTKEEWLFLHDLVIDKKPKTILEIGSYIYTSTLALLKAMNHNGGGSITSVDIDLKPNKIGEEDIGNVEWIKIEGKSQKVLPAMKGNKYDLIFIDGDHSFFGLTSDLTNALWLIEDYGTIVLHDANGTQIQSVIDRIIGKELVKWYHAKESRVKGLAVYEL